VAAIVITVKIGSIRTSLIKNKTMANGNGDKKKPKKIQKGFSASENPRAGSNSSKARMQEMVDKSNYKMFGSEILYKENKSYEDAVKSYDDSTKAGYSPIYPKMSDHFHQIKK
jgi:hypothetical protein